MRKQVQEGKSSHLTASEEKDSKNVVPQASPSRLNLCLSDLRARLGAAQSPAAPDNSQEEEESPVATGGARGLLSSAISAPSWTAGLVPAAPALDQSALPGLFVLAVAPPQIPS